MITLTPQTDRPTDRLMINDYVVRNQTEYHKTKISKFFNKKRFPNLEKKYKKCLFHQYFPLLV